MSSKNSSSILEQLEKLKVGNFSKALPDNNYQSCKCDKGSIKIDDEYYVKSAAMILSRYINYEYTEEDIAQTIKQYGGEYGSCITEQQTVELTTYIKYIIETEKKIKKRVTNYEIISLFFPFLYLHYDIIFSPTKSQKKQYTFPEKEQKNLDIICAINDYDDAFIKDRSADNFYEERKNFIASLCNDASNYYDSSDFYRKIDGGDVRLILLNIEKLEMPFLNKENVLQNIHLLSIIIHYYLLGMIAEAQTFIFPRQVEMDGLIKIILYVCRDELVTKILKMDLYNHFLIRDIGTAYTAVFYNKNIKNIGNIKLAMEQIKKAFWDPENNIKQGYYSQVIIMVRSDLIKVRNVDKFDKQIIDLLTKELLENTFLPKLNPHSLQERLTMQKAYLFFHLRSRYDGILSQQDLLTTLGNNK